MFSIPRGHSPRRQRSSSFEATTSPCNMRVPKESLPRAQFQSPRDLYLQAVVNRHGIRDDRDGLRSQAGRLAVTVIGPAKSVERTETRLIPHSVSR